MFSGCIVQFSIRVEIAWCILGALVVLLTCSNSVTNLKNVSRLAFLISPLAVARMLGISAFIAVITSLIFNSFSVDSVK